MPDTQIVLVLLLVVGTMVLFMSGRLRIDVVALCTLAALLILGLVDSSKALYGFASPATGTVGAMFVLSGGLIRTGAVDWLVRRLDRIAGTGEKRLLGVLCISIAVLSAFIINTATVAIFIPLTIALARQRKFSASRFLMPISYASQFGGVCTLVGTSTNLLVNTIAVSYGMQAFGFFEFAPLGVVMSIVGILYLMFATPYLLPDRKGKDEQVDAYRLADYLAELQVLEDSPLIGDTWNDSEAGRERELSLLKVIRDGKATSRARRTKIRAGDVLLLHGNMKRLLTVQERFGLEIRPRGKMSDRELKAGDAKLVEVLIPPRSPLVGRTLRGAGYRRRFGGVVLALQRRQTAVREQLSEVTLEAGDVLLVQCGPRSLARLLRSDDLIVTSELTELQLRKNRALIAVGLLVGVVAVAVAGILPIHVAALAGAVGMVLGRCLTVEEAYAAIDWKVIFLLGGILPLGLALEQTGAASWLAGTFLRPLVGFGPLVMLAVLYLVTALLTETMSNNASAVILAPIAVSLAGSLQVDPRPLLIAITFAASTSFATPIGYKTNAMVYAPGGYRFLDYTRVGGPLNLLFWILAIVLIPLLWPF